jgi:hypothetical protein
LSPSVFFRETLLIPYSLPLGRCSPRYTHPCPPWPRAFLSSSRKKKKKKIKETEGREKRRENQTIFRFTSHMQSLFETFLFFRFQTWERTKRGCR